MTFTMTPDCHRNYDYVASVFPRNAIVLTCRCKRFAECCSNGSNNDRICCFARYKISINAAVRFCGEIWLSTRLLWRCRCLPVVADISVTANVDGTLPNGMINSYPLTADLYNYSSLFTKNGSIAWTARMKNNCEKETNKHILLTATLHKSSNAFCVVLNTKYVRVIGYRGNGFISTKLLVCIREALKWRVRRQLIA